MSSFCWEMDLSEDFMREFQDKLDWESISNYQKLSKDFIIEFYDKLKLECMINNKNVDSDVKDELKIILSLNE